MTLNINVISIFPEMFDSLRYGIVSRAIEKQALSVALYNPRAFAKDKYRNVDDRPYGGGPGMVMLAQPLADAIDTATGRGTGKNTCSTAGLEKSLGDENRGPVIYLSPKGRRLTQADVKAYAKLPEMTLLSGRYEGIDERIIKTRVDEEVSIGDYVLAGGEFAAMVMIDAISRLLPGVLGNEDSAEQDSFFNDILDHPHYTRPECFENLTVPEVLLSGDHHLIKLWRRKQAFEVTKQRRPDLLFDPDD